jgi:hypothetical protein
MTDQDHPADPTSDPARAGAVRIPALTTRSALRWCVGTAVASLAVVAFLWVTQPENRVYAATLVPALALFFVVLLWQSTWFDPEAGTVTRVRCRRWRRTVRLEPATGAALVPSGGGVLLLALRPRDARRLFVPVLALTDYVEKSQAPELLRLLAGGLEQHRTGGARVVVDALRKQAAHLEAGGDARTSPLAGAVTYGVVTAAKAGGAGAVGGSLLG